MLSPGWEPGVCPAERKDGGRGPSGLWKGCSLLRGPKEPQSREGLWKEVPAPGKGTPLGGTQTQCARALSASTAHPGQGWGGRGQEMFGLPLAGLVGRGGPSSVVSSLRGVSPGPGLSTAHGEGKTYQRKSQLQMSPAPCPPPLSPHPAAPRTAHSQEARSPFLWDCSWP